MTNKKFWLGMLVMVLVFGMTVTITGCATAGGVMNLGDNNDAGIGEAEIIILSPGRLYENADMTVTLDGKLKGIMRANGDAKFVVPNGEHILKIDWKGTGTSTSIYKVNKPIEGEPYSFTVNSERIEFKPVIPATVFGKVTVQQVNVTSLRFEQ